MIGKDAYYHHTTQGSNLKKGTRDTRRYCKYCTVYIHVSTNIRASALRSERTFLKEIGFSDGKYTGRPSDFYCMIGMSSAFRLL
jgi:hypothetical protein